MPLRLSRKLTRQPPELAKSGQLREYTKTECDITLEELMREIEETSRKMDASVKRRIKRREERSRIFLSCREGEGQAKQGEAGITT